MYKYLEIVWLSGTETGIVLEFSERDRFNNMQVKKWVSIVSYINLNNINTFSV